MDRNRFNPVEFDQAKKYADEEKRRLKARQAELLRSRLNLSKETILHLIAEGSGDVIFHKLNECKVLDNDVFTALLTATPDKFGQLIKNINKFSGLDNRTALYLARIGQGKVVLDNQAVFGKVSEKEWEYIYKITDPTYDPETEYMYEEIDRENEWINQVEKSDNPKNLLLQAIDNGNHYYIHNFLNSKENREQRAFQGRNGWNDEGEHEVAKSPLLPGFDKDVAIALIEAHKSEELVRHMKRFSGLDKEVAEKLMKTGTDIWKIYQKMEYFPEPIPEVLGRCLEDLKKCADSILANRRAYRQTYLKPSFDGNTAEEVKFNFDLDLLLGGDKLKLFKQLDSSYMEPILTAIGQASSNELRRDEFVNGLFSQLSVFKELKKDSWDGLVKIAGKDGALWKQLLSQASFLEPSSEERAQQVRKTIGDDFLISCLQYFKDLPPQVGQELVKYKLGELHTIDAEIKAEIEAENYQDEFYDDDYDDYEGVGTTESYGDRFSKRVGSIIKNCQEITQYFGDKADRAFSRVLDEWGETENFLRLYTAYTSLLEGKITPELSAFGIDKSGQDGIRQLREKITQRVEAVLWKGDVETIEEVAEKKDGFVLPVAMKKVRFRESEWSKGTETGFISMLREYVKRKEKIHPLREIYQPSKTLSIAKTDTSPEAEKNITFTEDFTNRYTQIVDSLRSARRMLATPEGFNPVLSRIKDKIKNVRTEFAQKKAAIDNEKGKAAIQNNIDKLDEVLKGELSPQEQFNALRQFKGEFDKELRELIFFLGYHFNPSYADKDLEAFDLKQPSLEELSWTLNFVDHIVNKETFSKFFSDKKAAQNFRGLLNLTPLEDAMKQFNNTATKGTMSMKFVPDRGPLTEFSGHISDACWASEYKSILETFPNFTGLVMVQNPDNKFERLAGASMLIETESDKGEKLLVIRGLNPLENVINQLSPADFYKQLTDYLKPIAQKDGRKLSIVIDDHSGGAATNRPKLFSYLEEIRDNLTPVRLSAKSLTKFNDYNIVSDCYLVE